MAHFDSAVNYLTNLLAQQPVQLQLNIIELATIHNDLAYAYRDSRRYKKALEHYRIALDLKEKREPRDEVDLAITYSDMGWLLMNMDDLEKAEHLHEQALTIRERDLGHDHSDTAMSHNCLGLVYTYKSNFVLAKKHLTEALAIRQRCLPPQHPYTAMSYSSLASYFQMCGDGAEALKMEERALAIYKSSVPPTHTILKRSYHGVGSLSLHQRQWQKAIEHLNFVLTFDVNRNGNERAVVLKEIGQAYFGLGNYQHALSRYQEALILAKNAKNESLISEITTLIELVRNKNP